MTRTITTALLQVSSVIAMGAAAPSLAQTSADNMASTEIIVTARRQEESLQDVPLSVAAFDKGVIERFDISDLSDLARRTPNFSYSANLSLGTGVPVIRGVGAPRTGAVQSVGIFIDGIDTGNSSGLNLQTFDVERIEVVRGPQSTQFGRGVLGGAINYVSRRPNLDRLELEAQAELAEYGQYRFEGRVSGPVADGVAVSLAAQRRNLDGFYRNNLSGADTGGGNSTIVVGGARAKFGSDKQGDIYLRAAYNKENYGAPAWHQIPSNTQTGPAASQVWFLGQLTGDPALVSHNADNYRGLDVEYVRTGLVFEYDFGGVVLSTLTSYNNGTQLLDADNDFTSQPDLILGNNIFGNFRAYLLTDLEDYSQEVRLRSDGDSRLFWLVGGYFREEKFRQQDFSPVGANGSSNVLSTVPNRLDRDTRTLGLFGYVGVELSPGLKITQELRYSEDRVDESSTPRSTGITGSFGAKFTNFLPRTIIEYAASPDHLLYASVAKGNKPGGFNNSAGAGFSPVPDDLKFFDEEEVWSYEAGFKSSWLDGRLRLNAAAFYLDWSNIQVNSQILVGGLPVGLTVNGGEADGFGFEADLQFRASRNIEFYGGIGYSPVRVIDFTDSRIDRAGLMTPDRAQVAGSPDWTGNIGTVLTVPVTERTNAFLQADLTHRSTTFATEANLAETGAQTLVSMQAGLVSGPLRFTAFVNNLFDNKVIDSARAFVDPTSFRRTFIAQLPAPRQFGLRVAFRY
ncbi:MAG: TonB-dependent receptor [Polymorphobacter sp.]|uniref:TonB-dependent receptor n=1 Tax=Polymorphobacter sp. TaxID=1909290 RepID=UPI003A851449